MEYDGVNSVVCDAEENDWLEISYTDKNYIRPQASTTTSTTAEKPKKRKVALRIAVVAVLCVAVLAGMLFVDGDFKQDVFDAVKTASASIFNKTEEVHENKINIPCNLTLVEVQDGVMVFNGGRAALALTDGKVTDVQENSVTVTFGETSVLYSGLTSVFVAVNDEVKANSLIGKYDGQFTATLLQNGEVVKQVVGSETQLTWKV